VFVSFDLFAFLAWLFLSTLLPGIILSFSLFKKHEDFGSIEKLLIGFALGFVLLPLIPFLLYIIAGVQFGYTIAMISVALLYLIALVFFIKNKAYEGIIPNQIGFKIYPSHFVALSLIIILALTYLIRVGSYSPVFQELDPYYYTYTAYQILTAGYNPINDQTAWFPEVTVSHRSIPEISYLESIWYSLYSQGGKADNMLLADIASMYPPAAAVLSVFFIYLLVSWASKKEWGVIAAGIASFVPVFIYKLSAGEQEVQPYAFFALFFFYAMYALAMKKKDIRLPSMADMSLGKDAIYPVLAGLAFAALALGSSSQILAIASLILFIMAQALLFFFRDDDTKELNHLLLSNSIVFLIGPLIGSAFLKAYFETGALSFSLAVASAIPLLFAGVLIFIKQKVPQRTNQTAILGALIIIGLALYAFTPIGDLVKNVGRAGFEIAKYNAPLDRTIAEQGTAGADFGSQIGFIGQSYSLPPVLDAGSLINTIMFIVMLPFSFAANILLSLFVGITNLFLGTDVAFEDKDVSILLFWTVLFLAGSIYALWRFYKKSDDALPLFLLAIVMPPLVVGLIKAKYTIYAGVLLAVAIGFTLGQARSIADAYMKDEKLKSSAYKGLLALGAILVILQFINMGFAPSLLWGSFQTLYQNDPAALGPKLTEFCAAGADSAVCDAAKDPVGYASKGTNFQYDTKLCMLSMLSSYQSYKYMYDGNASNDALIPSLEASAASFRCQRISDYWIDSMEWIRDNTENGSRVTSWWDYGHWINYFGLRNAVIRNEHASHQMIGDVAHGYTDASPDEFKAWMKAHDSKYALFDIELVYGGGSLGGKYGALNYLSCARDNETSVAKAPGESLCEAEHLWEEVFVSRNPCTISTLTNRTGLTAYKIYSGEQYLSYYPSFCMASEDPKVQAYCNNVIRAVPAYCVGNATLADGQGTIGTYYLNETYPNGDLKLNKATLLMPYSLQNTMHLGPATGVTLFYTNDQVWLENGVVKSGFEDRKGKFYDSAIYRALFLNDLPGFKLAYSTPDGAVKIYKIEG